MNDLRVCDCCGRDHSERDLFEFEDQLFCRQCLDQETFLCSRCGDRLMNHSNAGDGGTPLCQHCYDQHYTSCDECGRVIALDDVYYSYEDDDTPLCYRCYNRNLRKNTVIHDYYYKPDPIFYGTGPRYFGVELEIDEGSESSDNANMILNAGNAPCCENIYIKHDGSLSDGFEIVTHPASLDYHMDYLPWGEIVETARQLGYRSHLSGSCGLHVHVSREAFGTTESMQDACIARVLYFTEKHWEELLKFSRRTPRQLERWAARYGLKERPRDILDHAKKGYHGGRYSCINLENSATIEFRIFRGTLKLNTLVATLQMVNRICDVAICLTDQEVKDMSWTSFVVGCTQPELIQYLKERRLYVNDPVVVDEEV